MGSQLWHRSESRRAIARADLASSSEWRHSEPFLQGKLKEPGDNRAVGGFVHHRFLVIFLGLLAGGSLVSAKSGSLLEQAVEDWLGERDQWAFTQRAVEYVQGEPRERLERYDPSQPGQDRWTLLAINGLRPTPAQHEEWARKKFRKNPRRIDTPIGDFFDFKEAKMVDETPSSVRYAVPLRRDKNWLFQADKVQVVVTVNKQSRALEHLAAHVREPVKVLLGLARIVDGVVNLNFLNLEDDSPPSPETTQPTGTAQVTVSKFGERAEFHWSDFERVSPAPVASVTSSRSG